MHIIFIVYQRKTIQNGIIQPARAHACVVGHVFKISSPHPCHKIILVDVYRVDHAPISWRVDWTRQPGCHPIQSLARSIAVADFYRHRRTRDEYVFSSQVQPRSTKALVQQRTARIHLPKETGRMNPGYLLRFRRSQNLHTFSSKLNKHLKIMKLAVAALSLIAGASAFTAPAFTSSKSVGFAPRVST